MRETLRLLTARAVSGLRWSWLLLVLAAFAVYPALRHNVAATAWDAGTVHIYQAVVYSDALSKGAVYPRWVQFLHLGLGSPLFTFRTPLVYGGMDLLYRLGLPHPVGWRVIMAIGLLVGCVGAYLLARELVKSRWPAVTAPVAFLYAPYVLRNVFERGTPEALGTFLYPWVLWSLIRLARRPSGGRFALTSALWAGCIAAHVLAPLMLLPLAALVALIAWWRYRTAGPLLALVAGGLLTAFIWAPMLSEQRWVHVERDFEAQFAAPASNPLPLDRLLAPPAVYDTLRDNNYTGDRMGLWHAALLILGIPATVYAWRVRRRDLALIAGIATLVGFLILWMLTAASNPVWTFLNPLLERLQYRSRLMGLQALAIAVVAAVAVALLPGQWQRRLALLLCCVLVLSAVPSLYVELQHRYAPFGDTVALPEVRAAEVASGGSAFTSFGEFMPRWRTAPFDQAVVDELAPVLDTAEEPLAEPLRGARAEAASVRSGAWDLTVTSAERAMLTLHLLYYPRWKGYLDGQPVALSPQLETGYVQLDVPAGTHQIALRYSSTPVERTAAILSGLTLLGLVALGAAWRSGLPGTRPVPKLTQARAATADLANKTGRYPPAGAASAPPWGVLVALTAVLAFKILYVDTATNWFRCSSTPDTVCGADTTVDAPFIGGPRLRGYSVRGGAVRRSDFAPGDVVRVTLYWQGEPGGPRRLTSFVHIRNSQPGGSLNPRTGNELWAQDEHEAPGRLLTTEYVPGRLYQDEFRLRLPDDIPPGTHFLEVGWADSATGEQLDLPVDAVVPPLRVLWHSVLLPSIKVRS